MNRGLNCSIFQHDARPHFRGDDLQAQSISRRCSPVRGSRCWRLDKDVAIKTFVEDNGLELQEGERGFYEFTKIETVQGYKEIILMDRTSGDFSSRARRPRELLGLPLGCETAACIRPTDLDKYAVFVQSTSVNRVLQSRRRGSSTRSRTGTGARLPSRARRRAARNRPRTQS